MSKGTDQSGGISKDNQLYTKVSELIELARKKVATAVNLTMVHTYFEIGRMIVEDEQQGKERAEYGKSVLKQLSKQLSEKFGKGFSVDNIERMKNFYLIYSNPNSATPLRKLQALEIQSHKISSTPLTKSDNSDTVSIPIYETSSRKLQIPDFLLSWSHYLILMRIENPQERSFYEIECASNNWSLKDLKRQYHSSLYERLALSRNKDDVMKLANEGQTIQKPEDILKNPLSLEFLGLEEQASYSETDLDHAIICYNFQIAKFLVGIGQRLFI